MAFTHQLFNKIINSVFSQFTNNLISIGFLHSKFFAQQVVIKEETASYGAWKETPIPVYTKFYFFDMLNPQVIVIEIVPFNLLTP